MKKHAKISMNISFVLFIFDRSQLVLTLFSGENLMSRKDSLRQFL